jgi:hypothetical protein
MTLAMARDGRNAGVTVAEINLKLIWDVITALKIGQSGYAYVVDGRGRLIAHPDISLVLRDTDLSKLPQVAAALNPQPGQPAVTTADNLAGRSVLTAHAATHSQLAVFCRGASARPSRRSGAAMHRPLLAGGLIAAALVALLLARHADQTDPAIATTAGGSAPATCRLHRHPYRRRSKDGAAFSRWRRSAEILRQAEQPVADRTAELSKRSTSRPPRRGAGVINSSPATHAVFAAMLDGRWSCAARPRGASCL